MPFGFKPSSPIYEGGSVRIVLRLIQVALLAGTAVGLFWGWIIWG